MNDEISIFVRRLKKIGIELELIENYPWIYLRSINGNLIKDEDFINANHEFTIGWSGVKIGLEPHLIEDRELIFKLNWIELT